MSKKLVSIRLDEDDLSRLEKITSSLSGRYWKATRSMAIAMLLEYSVKHFSDKIWGKIYFGRFDEINICLNDEKNSRP